LDPQIHLTAEKPKRFQLGRLATLNQILKAGSKTLRAMADGSLDSQLGARIMNGLQIQRGALELRELIELRRKLDSFSPLIDVSPTNRINLNGFSERHLSQISSAS